MKATLKIENIGQNIGLQTLSFNSGVVTLLQGRTAAGKSRIIKSFALALSYPIKSEVLIEEGINFGILKGGEAEYLPLVNSSMEIANIELLYDDVNRKVELFRDGKIKINTPGNQKFLYSSMLVKNSRAMAEPVGTVSGISIKITLKLVIQVLCVLCVNDGHSTSPYQMVGVMELLFLLPKEVFLVRAIIHP